VSQNIKPTNTSQANDDIAPVAPPSAKKTMGQTYGQIFASRRIAWMLFLGFASGLPLALSTGTLQAWLTVEGLDIKTIGFFALAGLPYTFKFVWAPLLDRFEPPSMPRRKGWLIFTQVALAALCFVMATLNAKTQVEAVGLCAVLIAFFSASQDIVCRRLRARLPSSHAGIGRTGLDLGRKVHWLAKHLSRYWRDLRSIGIGVVDLA
jgi:MFS transporter, PAT family, beta-lactamase induction signal transducer AmpG